MQKKLNKMQLYLTSSEFCFERQESKSEWPAHTAATCFSPAQLRVPYLVVAGDGGDVQGRQRPVADLLDVSPAVQQRRQQLRVVLEVGIAPTSLLGQAEGAAPALGSPAGRDGQGPARPRGSGCLERLCPGHQPSLFCYTETWVLKISILILWWHWTTPLSWVAADVSISNSKAISYPMDNTAKVHADSCAWAPYGALSCAPQM